MQVEFCSEHGCTNFLKNSRSYHKIPGFGTFTWIKLLVAEELRMLGATTKNSVAQVTWLPGFVYWLNICFCKKLVIMLFS